MAGTRSSSRLNANANATGGTEASANANKRKAAESPPAKRVKKTKTDADADPNQQTLEEVVAITNDQTRETKPDNDMREDANVFKTTDGDADEVTAEAKETNQGDSDKKNGESEQNEDHAAGSEDPKHATNNLKTATKAEESKAETEVTDKSSAAEVEARTETSDKASRPEDGLEPETTDQPAKAGVGAEAESTDKPSEAEVKPADRPADEPKSSTAENSSAIVETNERKEELPSNVLEKGIIYFFTRGRVQIEQLDSMQDIQRSHFVLRPLPAGAKISDGVMDDTKNNRLIAVPKKKWPTSGKERFMAFVEKARASNADLKHDFLQGNDYETASLGTRHNPPVTPIGEGVYAITSTHDGTQSHLVYMLTLPQEPGRLQADLGIRARGAFVLSLKNPEAKGPANAALPEKPDWPGEVIGEFRGRSWMPALPRHLDYANAQVLLIGEDLEGSGDGDEGGGPLQATGRDQSDRGKVSPEEVLEELEHEDEIRAANLKGYDTIFADLGISKKDYPSVKTTW